MSKSGGTVSVCHVSAANDMAGSDEYPQRSGEEGGHVSLIIIENFVLLGRVACWFQAKRLT